VQIRTWDMHRIAEYGIARQPGSKYSLMAAGKVMDGSMFRELLDAGIPIMIGWNSFGGHWQVIIGYDDMGSESTKDHVLILADPYDSTDHLNDGYNIQSFERFIYDWSAGFDPDFKHGIFVAAVPKGWKFSPAAGEGITEYKEGYDGDGSDAMKLNFGRSAADLQKYYPDTPWRGDNGLAGAATGGYERVPNNLVNVSPYYAHYDYYNWESGGSPFGGGELTILENFKTQQQTTEWTCGLTTILMAMEWHGANPGLARLLNAYSDEQLLAVAEEYADVDVWDLYDDRLTELNLAQLRARTRAGSTNLDDMKSVFDSLNRDEQYLNALAAANGWGTLKKWAYVSTDDLDDYDCITGEDGASYDLTDGLFQYYLGLGAPILIGWNEWGGHWQAVIGYDDMGTEGTQDDVLILADPYDTTDQNQDGYYLEAFERLVYGWNADFDSRGYSVFIIPYLADTDMPVSADYMAPAEVLGEILLLLDETIMVPDIGAIAGPEAAVGAVKAYLAGKGFAGGADYAVSDAAVLDGVLSDFYDKILGKVTVTLRVRCGVEIETVLVTIAGKGDFAITGVSAGNGQANVDFAIASANGKGYTLYLSETGLKGSFKAYGDVNYNSKGAHIKGLANGKKYYAYIEYNNGKGSITKSAVTAFTPSK